MRHNIIPWHRNCEMCRLERAEARDEEMANQIRELAEWNAKWDDSMTADEWTVWLKDQLTQPDGHFLIYGP